MKIKDSTVLIYHKYLQMLRLKCLTQYISANDNPSEHKHVAMFFLCKDVAHCQSMDLFPLKLNEHIKEVTENFSDYSL